MPDSADVFLVAGQSNAEGTGDPDAAPVVPEGVGYEYVPDDDALSHLEEPVGYRDGAASWAAFAREYHDRTGRTVVVVSMAVGGSAQHADVEPDDDPGHWDDGGELRPAAIAGLRDCLARLDAEGVDHEFRGVLWHQGETDAMAIDDGAHTVEEYDAAFRRMVAAFRREFDDPEMDVFLFRLGRYRDEDTAGWRAVRAAQDRFAVEDDYVHVVFADAVEFADSGNMQDPVHYDQDAYNRMGREGAAGVAGVLDG